MTIRILTDETIGKIAAGEGVERPASGGKEVLENALDSGAARVAIRIEGGGVDLIEITDDGCGIPPEELGVAVRRHATSKLHAFSDLDQLGTLGFRGEALPSIAAVTELAIRSRTHENAHGSAIEVTYGELSPVT